MDEINYAFINENELNKDFSELKFDKYDNIQFFNILGYRILTLFGNEYYEFFVIDKKNVEPFSYLYRKDSNELIKMCSEIEGYSRLIIMDNLLIVIFYSLNSKGKVYHGEIYKKSTENNLDFEWIDGGYSGNNVDSLLQNIIERL